MQLLRLKTNPGGNDFVEYEVDWVASDWGIILPASRRPGNCIGNYSCKFEGFLFKLKESFGWIFDFEFMVSPISFALFFCVCVCWALVELNSYAKRMSLEYLDMKFWSTNISSIAFNPLNVSERLLLWTSLAEAFVWRQNIWMSCLLSLEGEILKAYLASRKTFEVKRTQETRNILVFVLFFFLVPVFVDCQRYIFT